MKQNIFNTGTANRNEDIHKKYVPFEFSHVSKVSRYAVFFNGNGVIAIPGSSLIIGQSDTTKKISAMKRSDYRHYRKKHCREG